MLSLSSVRGNAGEIRKINAISPRAEAVTNYKAEERVEAPAIVEFDVNINQEDHNPRRFYKTNPIANTMRGCETPDAGVALIKLLMRTHLGRPVVFLGFSEP